jgi:membrane protease YdiL (CAAX protease family)
LIFSTILAFVTNLMSVSIFGVDVLDANILVNRESPVHVINASKFVQSGMAIGTFILPAIFASILFSTNSASYLHADKKPKAVLIPLVVVLMFVAVPFINWMMEVNGQLHLPESMKSVETWMKQQEDKAGEMTLAFLQGSSFSTLLFNLFVIAFLPALGEELLFRGVIQKLFIGLTNRKTAGIILTALLFSALHLQFYGFLPRLALGVLLGFLLEWSGSLWLPIIAHFVNNGAAVIMAWLASRNVLPFDPDKIGAGESQILPLLISVAITAAILSMIREKSKA